jgi:carbamate kinase
MITAKELGGNLLKQSFSVEQSGTCVRIKAPVERACIRVKEIKSWRTDNNVVVVDYGQGCQVGLRFDTPADAATAFDLIDLVVNGPRK